MQFELVNPERSLASLPADVVQVPGADGDMTIMPYHAPLVATLRPGVLTVEASGETSEYIVFGGFIQIQENSVSILAEKSVPRAEFSRPLFDEMLRQGQDELQALRELSSQFVNDAEKFVSDVKNLEQYIFS
ncbi:MAG: F0F1 ATP synthase subunit epsilon [Aestuariivita sp.]|nr:F0F1 ATP synthase subunit epsilon [Aestuariivita sp.]